MAVGRIAVLGDMLEPGENSPKLHAELSDTLDPQIINEVYLYGPEMKNLYDASQGKYESEHLHYYTKDQMDRMIDDLKNDAQVGRHCCVERFTRDAPRKCLSPTKIGENIF